jgi:hypothetical protein
MKIQSGLLLQSGTSGKALKCYFSGFMAWVFTEQSLFLSIKLSWNYKPSGFCQQGFSAKLWENRDLIHQPLVINIFVRGEFPVYISNRPSGIGQKLNWNVTQALEKAYTTGILSYTDSWCLVPFSTTYVASHDFRARPDIYLSGVSKHLAYISFPGRKLN